MDAKFYTNKIKVAQDPDGFQNFVKKILHKDEEVVKTASAEEVKTAEQDEADSSGQPEAEAKLVNTPEKEGGKGKGSAAGGKCCEEGEDSGQPKAEAKLVNHPKVECEGEEEVKTAKAKDEDEEEDEDKEEKTAEVKEAGELPEALKKHQFKAKGDKDDDDDDDDDDDKDDDKDDDEKEDKEAKSVIKIEKVAKLNSPTREMLKEYWLNIFPPEYVEAMLAEK
jgi:hypothetical protein